MEEFPGNSHTQRQTKTSAPEQEEKRVNKVVTGEVIQRKKPVGKRFVETFFGGDAKNVPGHVVFDIMIPALKDMVLDITNEGMQRALWGEVRNPRRGPGARGGGIFGNAIYNAPQTAYNRYADDRRGDPREPRGGMSRRARSNFDFDEIILATRAEANEVIDQLYAVMTQYDEVTVADLYEMVGVSSNYTDRSWGWTNLSGAGITRVGSGYLLDLPRPEQLAR